MHPFSFYVYCCVDMITGVNLVCRGNWCPDSGATYAKVLYYGVIILDQCNARAMPSLRDK